MKLKGVNIFEAHVEKLVLGVVALIFLGVVAMQFLSQPNRIQIPQSQEKLAPRDAFKPAERLAEQLDARMTRIDPDLPEGREFDMLPRFIAALEQPVAPSKRLAGRWPAVEIAGGADVGGTEGLKIALPRIPGPVQPVADVYLGTIDPWEAQASPELAAMLPPQQPFDVRAVTVEATYNARQLLAALERDPDGAGELLPLNPGWWRGLVEILAVRLEREELLPSGEWTNLVELPLPPGRASILGMIDESITRTRDMEVVVAEASRQASEVRRPPFYARIAGADWVPPTESAAARARGLARSESETLLARRQELQRDAARIEARIGAGPRQTEQQRQPGPGGGRDVRGTPPQEQRDPNESSAVRTMRRTLERIYGQIDEVDAQLRALGHDPSGAAQPGAMTGLEPTPQTPLLEDQAVRLWTFDLTAKPGATYRYRMRIVVNNPAFGRGAALHESVKPLAETRVILSEPSPWTDPITVDPESRFFITTASDGGANLMGGPRATAEVFTFYYGFWRKGSISLEPGDRIRAVAKLPDNLLIFDAVEAAPGGQPPPPPPGAVPPAPGQQAPSLPPGARPAAKEVTAMTDVILLDVSSVPGASIGRGLAPPTPKFQAILRNSYGELEIRQPDQDRASEIYARLTASAKQGETQGQPVPEPEPTQPPPGPGRTPRPEPEPSRPPPGGGGGGGGGGG